MICWPAVAWFEQTNSSHGEPGGAGHLVDDPMYASSPKDNFFGYLIFFRICSNKIWPRGNSWAHTSTIVISEKRGKRSHDISFRISWQQKHIVVVALSYDSAHFLEPGIGRCRGEERRGGRRHAGKERAVRGSCELNDMASRGGSSEIPWRGEMAATTMWRGERAWVMRYECERCAMRWQSAIELLSFLRWEEKERLFAFFRENRLFAMREMSHTFLYSEEYHIS
jgi:hypothetical protein